MESATQNKKYINGEYNSHRLYQGVGRALIAFACAYSFECGLEGYIELTTKTSKFPFYLGMGGIQSYGNQVYFPTKSSIKVIENYLPGGVQWWRN